jgi:hypothetical protein
VKKQFLVGRLVLHAREKMKAVVLLISLICLSSCSWLKDSSDQAQSNATNLQEQRRDIKQEEDFARGLPKPH